MDDKIKAKAQEVRLAMLEALARQVKDVETSVPAEEVSGNIDHLAGILNQLDPGAGIGSYAASAIDPQELGCVGGYKAG